MYSNWTETRKNAAGENIQVQVFMASGILWRNPQFGDNLRPCQNKPAARRLRLDVGKDPNGKRVFLTMFAHPGRNGEDINIQKLDGLGHGARIVVRGRETQGTDPQGQPQTVRYVDFVEIQGKGQVQAQAGAPEFNDEGVLPNPSF